ncbi:hypothetical protein chiPu_0032167, partial [Chiloscyllium punctatum]|nr:hypothetical protein [Chiloscyllium punctatum]
MEAGAAKQSRSGGWSRETVPERGLEQGSSPGTGTGARKQCRNGEWSRDTVPKRRL